MIIDVSSFVAYTLFTLAILLPIALILVIVHFTNSNRSAIVPVVFYFFTLAVMVGSIAAWPWSGMWQNGIGGWMVLLVIGIAYVNYQGFFFSLDNEFLTESESEFSAELKD